MKISFTLAVIRSITQFIITWIFLNIFLNMLGLWFTKLLNPDQYTYIDNIANEFIIPLSFQALFVFVCLIIGNLFMKNSVKILPYIAVLVQVVIFHVIFFANIKFHHGMHFESSFENFGIKYLSMFGQYFVDILYVYIPIDGNFENGLFIPKSIVSFYIHWILLNLVYYTVLSWLSTVVAAFIFENKVTKPEIKSVLTPTEI